MRRLPVEPMVMPADLQGIDNGKLPAKLLTDILPSGRLHHYAAESWQRLQQSAAYEGLTLTQVGDYRALVEQQALFMQRMRPYPDAKRNVQVTRQWNGQTWYLHLGAPVATPGTSNHGWGLAIDVALRVDGRAIPITARPQGAWRSGLQFLRKLAPSLGWSWELQNEPWHIRYVLGRRLG